MHRLLVVIFSLLLVAAGPKPPVIVTLSTTPPIEVNAGATVELPLVLKILTGYHIQANPASQKYLIPLIVKLEKHDGIQIGETIYPKGVPFRLKGSDQDISTYDNTVVIKVPLQIDEAMKPGEVVLKGTLRYQGCDDFLCFPPVTIPLQTKLLVE